MEYNMQGTAEKIQVSTAPIGQLNTNRSLIKIILLGIITLGIYPIVVYSGISNDINVIASKYDGKKTMHYCLLVFVVGIITLGIGYLVWNHNIANRIGNEARRRGIDTNFSSSTYWLWGILGSFIVVGPFIYIHKLITTSNQIAADYNING